MAYKSGFGLNRPRQLPVVKYPGETGVTSLRTDGQKRLHHDDYNTEFRFQTGGIAINVKPKASESNAAHNALDSYGQNFPIFINKGIVGDDYNTLNYHHSNRKNEQKMYAIDLPAYLNTSWLYGAAVRIYSDGTGAGVFFLDSEANGETFSRYLQSGGDVKWVQYDSDWNKWGGLLASTTPSAPDSDLRNTAADSDWYNSNKPLLTSLTFNNGRYRHFAEQGGSHSQGLANSKAILYEAIGGFDSDYSTRNFIERGAYEDAQASAGTGTADPESWS